MTFPFDGEDHRLYVGESYTGSLQYHSVKYDFKPPSIDFDKEGILESDGTKCKIRFPNKIKNDQPTKASTVYEGKIQEIEKECILIIDRKTNTITLERVTSKVSVRNTREKDDKVHEFPVMRSLDRPAVSSLSRSSAPLKSSKQERKAHLPVKKPRHEIAAPKPKTESSDLIMPTLGGGGGGASSTGNSTGETITAQIIGLPDDDHDIKQSEKVESKRPPEVNSIFSPGNSDSSSSSSSSDDDSDNNQSSEDDDDDSDDSQTSKPDNPPKNDLLSQLDLSEESGSDDTM